MWLLVAVAGSGCNSLLGIDELTLAPIDAPGSNIDAAIDASIDAPPDAPGEECFGTLAETCFVPVITGPITIATGNINTTSATTEPRCKTVTM